MGLLNSLSQASALALVSNKLYIGISLALCSLRARFGIESLFVGCKLCLAMNEVQAHINLTVLVYSDIVMMSALAPGRAVFVIHYVFARALTDGPVSYHNIIHSTSAVFP